jgi:alpha-beta hydrolase superfamily lysophospholipase
MNRDKETGIIYKEWKSPSPKAVFLLVHGLGAHTARWEFLSDFFLRNNISSYALELKGFSETEDLKGHIDSFNIYFNDIKSLRDIIARENSGKRVFLLGDSIGGLISFLTVIESPGLFNGLICISPAFMSALKVAPLDYVRKLLPLFYNPKKQFNIPFDSRMCTRDVDYQKVLDSDPKEHRLATSKFIFELFMAQLRANILKNKASGPVLFLLSGEDKLVDPQVSKRIFEGMKSEDKTIIEYPEMYHALSIDLGREKVFKDILDWAQKRI